MAVSLLTKSTSSLSVYVKLQSADQIAPTSRFFLTHRKRRGGTMMITHPSGSGVRNVRGFTSETPPEVGIRMPCGGVLTIVYGRRGTPFWGRRPSGEALTVRTRPPA